MEVSIIFSDNTSDDTKERYAQFRYCYYYYYYYYKEMCGYVWYIFVY